MRDDMRTDVNWNTGNYGIAEILIGFTGINMADATGCINAIPGSGGSHPYIIISNWSSDMARSVMHENTHAYGFSHTLSCTNQIPGIMATDAFNSSCNSSIYIKNWTPADDTTMEARRTGTRSPSSLFFHFRNAFLYAKKDPTAATATIAAMAVTTIDVVYHSPCGGCEPWMT